MFEYLTLFFFVQLPKFLANCQGCIFKGFHQRFLLPVNANAFLIRLSRSSLKQAWISVAERCVRREMFLNSVAYSTTDRLFLPWCTSLPNSPMAFSFVGDIATVSSECFNEFDPCRIRWFVCCPFNQVWGGPCHGLSFYERQCFTTFIVGVGDFCFFEPYILHWVMNRSAPRALMLL